VLIEIVEVKRVEPVTGNELDIKDEDVEVSPE
jgi:hypothetical protein